MLLIHKFSVVLLCNYLNILLLFPFIAETVQIENSIAEQITIVNGNGETIGIVTECDGDQVAAITAAHEAAQTLLPVATHIPPFTFQAEQPRKRRLPSKFRDMIVESSPVWKRMATEQSLQQHTADTANKDELEIDVTGLTGIKLKTKAYHEEDIMTYLSRVEEKLDCIIKHFNVPLNTDIAQRVSPDNTPKNKSLKKTSQQCALSNESSMMNNIAASLNMNHRASVNGHHEQDLGYVSSDSPQNVLEITQYVISEDLLNAVYMKSRNRGNFAKHLVFAAFPIEERLGRNCYGRRGGTVSGPKHPLENAKLEAVREAVFKKFPVLGGEEIDSVWKRECVIAIDTALRSEMRTHVLSMQNTIKREMTEILPADMKEGVKGSMAMNVTM